MPSDVASYQSLLEGSAKAVDGRYARSLLQTRTVFGPATWQLAASLSGNAGDVTASDYLSMRSAGLSVSALIPAEDGTTKIQAALVSKLGAPNSAVAPVWGLELLSDPYSLASSGERLLTAFLYFNFKVIRADGFSRLASRWHSVEYRFLGMRQAGRVLSGVALRYGDVARIGGQREKFLPGSFPGVEGSDILLNRQHDRTRALARSQGGA